jgi:protein-ribulosamine 3-kinase
LKKTFRKTGPESAYDMFAAEADGLAELRAADEIRVPDVIDLGVMNGQAYIDLEHLDLMPADRNVERALGERLAALHRHTTEQFGWFRDNTIGLTPQHNDLSDSWPGFYRTHRHGYQVKLAIRNGFGTEIADLGDRVAERLVDLFEGYDPAPSLLHGDLWGGNWGCVDREPVLYDPAVYFGDRETDIAMTMLFGGFGDAFYAAYQSAWPMEPGHEQRLKLYRLYHVLNHLNLFGRSYLGQAVSLMQDLLRDGD